MRKEDLKIFEGKKVFLVRKNGFHYSNCDIVECSDSAITIIDFKGIVYVFQLDDIMQVSDYVKKKEE